MMKLKLMTVLFLLGVNYAGATDPGAVNLFNSVIEYVLTLYPIVIYCILNNWIKCETMLNVIDEQKK